MDSTKHASGGTPGLRSRGYGVRVPTRPQVEAGETTGPFADLTPAEHDRLHWLAAEVIAGRITLAEAERLAVRL